MKQLITLSLLCISCCLTAQNNTQQKKDSLRTVIASTEGEEKITAYNKLTAIYYVESSRDSLKMDTLLTLYSEYDAEAIRQRNYKSQGLIRANTLMAYSNRMEDDRIFELAPGYLAFLATHEVWSYYYAVYRMFIQAFIYTGKYDEGIKEAQKMYEEAKLRGHEDGVGMALFVISKAYGKMNRIQEEEKCIRECIQILKKQESLLWITADAYFILCNQLLKMKRYEEVRIELLEYEKLIYRFEKISGSSQIPSWSNWYGINRRLYLALEDYDQAEAFCDKQDSIDGGIGRRSDVLTTRCQIYYGRKQYDKALETAEQVMSLAAGNLNAINAAVGLKIMILCSMKDAEDVYKLFEQAANLRDSIRNVEINAQLDELRTVYETDKITAEKEAMHRALLFTIGGACILLILLGVILYFYRKKQIAYRELVRKGQQWAEIIPPEDGGSDTEEVVAEAETGQPETSSKPDISDEVIMTDVDMLMKKKKLYTHPELTLDTLSDTIGISRYYLSKAVNRCSGKSFTTYINEYRIKEAIRLMSDKKSNSLSIDGIAYESGFADRANFYRVFKKMTGLPPATFRSNLQAN